jgi:transcriptional regulator with XRE-family HTH domain
MIDYETFCKIREYREQRGLKVAQIARALDLDRRTVAKWPECRDARDAKRDVPVALSPSLTATAYYAAAALRPCRFATSSQARTWLRSTPTNNGMVRPAS